MSDIFAAAEAGDAEEIARLIAADPESARRRGGREPSWTPIMYSWFPNRSTVDDVAALIAAGADTSVVKVPTGWSALDALF